MAGGARGSVTRASRQHALRALCCAAWLAALPHDDWAKRAAPRDVAPVIAGEVEYTAPTDRMGVVVASDLVSHKMLWCRRIYVVHMRASQERDVPDVFITELALEGRLLIVSNERGNDYALDLKTLRVKSRRSAGGVSASSRDTAAPDDLGCAKEGDTPDANRSIGIVTMLPEGTLRLQLRAELQGGTVGDSVLLVKPGEKSYEETIRHVGGIKIGESKQVPPWPNVK